MKVKTLICFLMLFAVASMGTVKAEGQKQFRGDLALSWFTGPVKTVRNTVTKSEMQFDRDGKLIKKTVNGKPVIIEVQSRDAAGRPLSVVTKEVESAAGVLRIYTYDLRGRVLTEIKKNNSTGKTLFSRRYIYKGDSDYPCGYGEVWGKMVLPASFRVGDPNTTQWEFKRFDFHGNPTVLDQVVEEEYIIEYYTD